MKRYRIEIFKNGDHEFVESPTGDYIRHDDPALAALVEAARRGFVYNEYDCTDRDVRRLIAAYDRAIKETE